MPDRQGKQKDTPRRGSGREHRARSPARRDSGRGGSRNPPGRMTDRARSPGPSHPSGFSASIPRGRWISRDRPESRSPSRSGSNVPLVDFGPSSRTQPIMAAPSRERRTSRSRERPSSPSMHDSLSRRPRHQSPNQTSSSHRKGRTPPTPPGSQVPRRRKPSDFSPEPDPRSILGLHADHDSELRARRL
jgi:hypothetical protein